ncbi:ATP-binding cassette domain-containing protein [Umezawaea sp.]|uniref:ATP-binding cassette domain-containing protein n=1 Tax=Umezawaea sp. TaxID=1955258 RepID=UPI002ED661DF
MEIHAQRVGVTGAHGPLLRPTTLRVGPGEFVLVAGEPGAGHTALGLALSGRLRPSTGSVLLDGTDNPSELRGRVALVDAPEVNEPEAALKLSTVVGEELAMIGERSGRKAVADWLVEHGAEEHATSRFEHVPADLRCALLLELAAARPGVGALVLDSPDRYHGTPETWLGLARALVTPERSVVVLCSTSSARLLDVTAARLGEDNTPEVDDEEEAQEKTA